MTEGNWFDTAALVVVGLVCAGLIGRRLLAAFTKSSGAGCGGCSKCGGGDGDARA